MKYVLTIAAGYVTDWTIAQAIRELLQNKIDQETIDPTNVGSIKVDGDSLSISNKTSKLTASSLVLGCSSKQDDDTTIGKFGEGYKLALLVLLRNNIKVVIHNYHEKQTWIPAFEYVEKYKSELLVINSETHWFKGVPDDNLEFVITGLDDPQKYIDEVLLNRSMIKSSIRTCYGEILEIEEKKGLIYVSGLFVTKVDDLVYSYNFNPSVIEIGRDRNLADKFDIQIGTRRMWIEIAEEHHDLVMELINTGASDVYAMKYGFSRRNTNKVTKELVNLIGHRVPVTSEADVVKAKKTYGDDVDTIVVNEQVMNIVKDDIPIHTPIEVKSTEELAVRFFNRHKKRFSKDMLKDWNKLINSIIE